MKISNEIRGRLARRRRRKVECAIVFTHFQDDAITRHHLKVLRRANPYPVIPVTRGKLGVKDRVEVLGTELVNYRGWRHADLQFFDWFKRRDFDAERYVTIEWDVFAPQPVKKFYGARWDAPVVATRLLKVESSDWMWFREVPQLPVALQQHAMGLEPLAVLLWRHDVLEKICAHEIPADIYCELRAGTLVRAHGFEAVDFPEACETIRWGPMRNIIEKTPARASIFHPVKDCIIAPP